MVQNIFRASKIVHFGKCNVPIAEVMRQYQKDFCSNPKILVGTKEHVNRTASGYIHDCLPLVNSPRIYLKYVYRVRWIMIPDLRKQLTSIYIYDGLAGRRWFLALCDYVDNSSIRIRQQEFSTDFAHSDSWSLLQCVWC